MRSLINEVFMMRFICLILLTVVSLNCFSINGRAQQRHATKEPFQITDASTGKPISKVLVIPLYSSATGVFVAPEGPAKGTAPNYYSNNPFVYITGQQFILKRPQFFTGLPLFMVFIGKARETERILVVAPGYRPLWFNDLWWYPQSPGDKRKMELTPISDGEWSRLLAKELSPLVKDSSLIKDNCQFWRLPEQCALKIDYNKKERKLIHSFLQKGIADSK